MATATSFDDITFMMQKVVDDDCQIFFVVHCIKLKWLICFWSTADCIMDFHSMNFQLWNKRLFVYVQEKNLHSSAYLLHFINRNDSYEKKHNFYAISRDHLMLQCKFITDNFVMEILHRAPLHSFIKKLHNQSLVSTAYIQ